MLSVFIGILTVVIVVVSVLLIFIVLMQRPKQEGLGAAFGGGMMDSVAGAHTTDVLQKATIWLASVFLGGAIVLAVLKAQELKAIDPGEVLPEPAAEPALPSVPPSISDLPTPPTPATAPAAPTEGEKTKADAEAPAAPAKAPEADKKPTGKGSGDAPKSEKAKGDASKPAPADSGKDAKPAQE